MTTQHTPGTWYFSPTAGGHQFSIFSDADETGKDIAIVYNNNEKSKADAKLMAAAPDLLAALQIAEVFMTANREYVSDNDLHTIHAAIQRATNP